MTEDQGIRVIDDGPDDPYPLGVPERVRDEYRRWWAENMVDVEEPRVLFTIVTQCLMVLDFYGLRERLDDMLRSHGMDDDERRRMMDFITRHWTAEVARISVGYSPMRGWAVKFDKEPA